MGLKIDGTKTEEFGSPETNTMFATASYTTIEETAMLQNDTPELDFACHYYNTRYDRLRGIIVGMGHHASDINTLRDKAKEVWDHSLWKNSRDLVSDIEQKKHNPSGWSMTWFRLRTFSGMIANGSDKTYTLTDADRAVINAELQESLKDYTDLNVNLFLIQKEKSDTLLVAIHMALTPEATKKAMWWLNQTPQTESESAEDHATSPHP